jgi:integrase
VPIDLTLDQIYLLVNEASQLDRSFALQLFFIIFTGCTVEESRNLTWEDVYLDECEVRFGEKKYQLNIDALQILSGCSREFDPYVFGYRHSSQIHNKTRILERRIGDKFTVSELRDAYAALTWWKPL